MDKVQALTAFWNSFGLSAYDENTVPDNAALPYITFSVGDDDFDHPVSLTSSIWYRSKRWDEITNKLNEVSQRIGRGGIMVPYDGGAFWVKKGTPFAQRASDPDDSIRRIFINVEVEFIGG